MSRTTTAHERAALAARFSSAPDAERPTDALAEVVEIRSIASSVKLPSARHHAMARWLAEEALTLSSSPKWIGMQAAIEELIGLVLTDETVARRLHEALKARELARRAELREGGR